MFLISLESNNVLLGSCMNGIRMPYIDIGSIDVVRVRNSLLRLQHHSIEVI